MGDSLYSQVQAASKPRTTLICSHFSYCTWLCS